MTNYPERMSHTSQTHPVLYLCECNKDSLRIQRQKLQYATQSETDILCDWANNNKYDNNNENVNKNAHVVPDFAKEKMPSKKVSHPQWKEVKLSGNLITDDSVGTLEGLVGLEVLEDYDGRLVTTTKPSKKKKQKQDKRKSTETHTNGHNDSEDESLPPPTKKSKKEGKKKEVTEESEPGQFVRAPNVVSDEEVDAEEEEVVDLPEWQQFGLHELLLKALKENGFTKPTQIQSLTLPAAVMGRRDILGAAETGSGKTLAFGLPILNGILELKKNLDDNPNYKLRKGGE